MRKTGTSSPQLRWRGMSACLCVENRSLTAPRCHSVELPRVLCHPERNTRSCTSVMFHTGVVLVTFRFLFPFFLFTRQYMVQRKGAERALFKSCWQGHPSRPVPVIQLWLWSDRGKPPPPCTVRPVLLSLAAGTAARLARRAEKFTGAPAGLCCCQQPAVQRQSPFSLPAAQPPPHLRL